MKAAKDNPCLCALRSFFAERFPLTRDSLGLTQMEFALDLGIDRRSYLDIEHRKNLCCAVTLLAYLCYFLPLCLPLLACLSRWPVCFTIIVFILSGKMW